MITDETLRHYGIVLDKPAEPGVDNVVPDNFKFWIAEPTTFQLTPRPDEKTAGECLTRVLREGRDSLWKGTMSQPEHTAFTMMLSKLHPDLLASID
jgi:hypothetical protein